MTQQEREKQVAWAYDRFYNGPSDNATEAWEQFVQFEAYKSIPLVSNPEITEAYQPDKPTEWIKLNGVAREMPNINAWLLDPNGVITFYKQDEYIPIGYYTHYLPIELPTPPQKQKP